MKPIGVRRLKSLGFSAVLLVTGAVLNGCDSPTPNDGRATVVWLAPTDDNRKMTEELVARFERENPTVHIDIRWTPGAQYSAKLKTLVAAGLPPDVFVAGDVWVPYLRPFLLDLKPYLKRDAKEVQFDDFYPGVQRACEYQGGIYYLPRLFNVSLLYYNRRLFREAGEPIPDGSWTVDKYLQVGERLTAKGRWGSTIVTGWWGEWLMLVRGQGGDLFNADVTRCTLDTPAAIRGLALYRDKITKYKISPAPGRGPATGFASGEYAMEFGGHLGNWATYNKIEGLDWDVAPLPKGPAGTSGAEVTVDALGVSSATAHREAAWKFIRFMASPEAIERYVKQGFVSARRSVAERSRGERPHPDNLEAIPIGLEDSYPTPQTPHFMEIALDLIQPEIDRMLTEGQSPEETGRRAAKAANDFLAAMGAAKP